MPQFAVSFAMYMEIWERNDAGTYIKHWEEFDANLIQDNSFNYTVSIQSTLTSNSDTCEITIPNHPELETLYRDKKAYFDKLNEKNLEVNVLLYYINPHATLFPDKTHCIFTGDLTDIYVSENSTPTDQSLTFKCTHGYRAALRAEVDKSYPAGTAYRNIVLDLFNFFTPYGYGVPQIDDPNNKLAKLTKRPRTFHGKVSDALNSVAKDLEMIWSFYSNPWTYQERGPVGVYPGIPSNPAVINNPKKCWFCDKVSVFDPSQIHSTTGKERSVRGINGLEVNGSTSKLGLMGYTKSQFTFTKPFDPSLQVGMPVFAADVGARNQYTEFVGRINRISINNEIMNCECSYIDDDTNLAVLEQDGKNTGALLL